MIEWYKKVVFENYLNFDGRARRSEYWWFTLMSGIISTTLVIIGIYIEFPLLSNIYSIAVLIPSIAVGVRRMHDIGKSGWYIIIPIYNIVLLATEGDYGENEYGEDPKNNIDTINEIGQS